MNVEKAEIKAGMASEIGNRLDDTLESVTKEVAQWEGANMALVQAGKAIEELGKHVDKDLDEGQYDLETAALIKKYITRSAALVQNLAMQASNRQLMARGKVEVLGTTITIVKGLYDSEIKKVESFKQAVASGLVRLEEDGTQQAVVSVPGVNGVRPGMSIKEQRLAEEAAEAKAAAEAEATPQDPPEKKRGGRGKRAANS